MPDGGIPDYIPVPTDTCTPPTSGPIPSENGNDTPVVPEPGTLVLLAIGSGLGGLRYLKKRRQNEKQIVEPG
jgi:hypothetical protein